MMPTEVVKLDDDIGGLIWKGANKQLIVSFTKYGTVVARCGVAGGSQRVQSFEEGWKWFCSDQQTLPTSTSKI